MSRSRARRTQVRWTQPNLAVVVIASGQPNSALARVSLRRAWLLHAVRAHPTPLTFGASMQLRAV
ncbi:MAG: hypothetical protein QM784_36020 [Polyangiaceae bacterium]